MNFQSKRPPAMIESIFFKELKVSEDKIEKTWKKLQKRETFVKSQLPPYKVEFDNISQQGTFECNELNIHYGPFLHLPAILGEVKNDYRDLKYLYGAYVFSFRFIRPVRLEFFRNKQSISLKLTSYVHPWLRWLWPKMNKFFWYFFKI